jgi:hypothetical protein
VPRMWGDRSRTFCGPLPAGCAGQRAVSAKKRRVLSWVVEAIAPLVQDYAQVTGE